MPEVVYDFNLQFVLENSSMWSALLKFDRHYHSGITENYLSIPLILVLYKQEVMGRLGNISVLLV